MSNYNKIVILTSGHFLTQNFPNNYDDMDESELNDFISDNTWDALDGRPPEDIYAIIDDAAYVTEKFISDDRQQLATFVRDFIKQRLDDGRLVSQAFDDDTLTRAIEAYSNQ